MPIVYGLPAVEAGAAEERGEIILGGCCVEEDSREAMPGVRARVAVNPCAPAFPLSDVKALMGHADIATTMVYVRPVPQPDASDRLTRLVASAQEVAEVEASGKLLR